MQIMKLTDEEVADLIRAMQDAQAELCTGGAFPEATAQWERWDMLIARLSTGATADALPEDGTMDIIEKLRRYGDGTIQRMVVEGAIITGDTHGFQIAAGPPPLPKSLAAEAADEIERLQETIRAFGRGDIVPVTDKDAENERLRAALASCASWIDRWTKHVGACEGGNKCTCGRTAVLYEANSVGEQEGNQK